MRLICPIVLVLASIGGAFAAQEPWALSAEEEKTCTKAYPEWNMWASTYQRARDYLTGSKPDPEKAACGLKLAIKKNPSSSLNASHPTSGERFEYLPYFYLSVVLDMQKSYAAAKRCLDKDPQAATSKSVGPQYVKLRDRLEPLVAWEVVARGARTLTGWNSDTKVISLLSSDAAGAVSRIKGLLDQLDKISGADAAGTLKNLRDAIVGLCEGEAGARAGLIEALGREPWKGAFTTAADRPAASACQAPRLDPKSLDTDGPIKALQECDAKVADAVRRAGRWKCNDLGQKRSAVIQSLALLKAAAPEKAATLGSPESLSPSCDPFEKAEASGLAQAFTALSGDYKRPEEDLRKRGEQIVAELGRVEAGVRGQIQAALDSLPDVPKSCPDVVRAGSVIGEMATLRQRLTAALTEKGTPSSGAMDSASRAGGVRERFVEATRKGVEGLIERGRKAKVADQVLADLKTAKDSFDASAVQTSTLCQKAIAANKTIEDYWRGNVDQLRKEVDLQAGLVGAVVRAMDEPAVRETVPAGDLAAARNARDQLERARRGAAGQSPESWVEAAQAASAAGEQALAPFHDRVGTTRTELGQFMARVPEILNEVEPALPGGPPAGSNAPARAGTKGWAAEVRRQAVELTKKLGAVDPLYAASGGLDATTLRQHLQEAGVDGRIRPEDWALLTSAPEAAGGEGAGSGRAGAARVIRDVAVLPLLADAGRKRDEWKPFLDGARPFATLNVVLRDFANGDLEVAILRLREAGKQPWMGERGRTPALAHAVMALMLDMKSTAVGSQGGQDEVIASLRAEARREADLARKADQTFRPPDGLFKSQSLQRRLEALLHEAAAG